MREDRGGGFCVFDLKLSLFFWPFGYPVLVACLLFYLCTWIFCFIFFCEEKKMFGYLVVVGGGFGAG